MWEGLTNFGSDVLKCFGGGDKDKGWQGILGAALGVGAGYDSYKDAKEAQDAFRKRPTSGYQGGIPDYTAVRQRVPMTGDGYDANRRPGSSGRRYFTDVEFVGTPEYVAPTIPEGASNEAVAALHEQARTDQQNALAALIEGAQGRSDTQKWGLAAANLDSPTTTVSDTEDVVQAAGGGLMGMYLGGKTDGMADQIPARIDGTQEARLSDGEYVVPADAVSHLGNGNSDAGAKVLKDMISRVRQERTGNPRQGKEINPNHILPV